MHRIWIAKTSWVVLVSALVALLAAAACGGDDKPAAADVDTEALSALVQEAVTAASSEAVSAEDIAAMVDTAVMKAAEAGGEALSADDVAGIVASALAEQATTAASAQARPILVADMAWDSYDIMRILFEKVAQDAMGYEIKYEFPGGSSPMWISTAAGDIDVSIETWVGSEASFAHYEDLIVNKQEIEKVTPLGYFGHNKMAVPTYVIEGDPERGIEPLAPDLKTWEDLRKYADVFAVTETAPKGRFLGANPGWGSWDTRFTGMGLDDVFQVQFAGSEPAMLAELDASYRRGEPIIFYAYVPHYMVRKWDLTEIEQAAWSQECHRDPTTGPCGQPLQDVFSMVHTGFDEEFPEVYQMLRNMNDISDNDMGEMLLAYDQGSSYEEAVQAWMDRNQAKWQAWIP